jgi:hypothetical protein
MATATKSRAVKDKLNRDANGIDPRGHQYLWGLGLDEEHISVHGLCLPSMMLADVKAKGREAARVEKLGRGGLRVTFMPGMHYDDDTDAANHLYHVRLEESVLDITLDDRVKGVSLRNQLIVQLRENAERLTALALRIEVFGSDVTKKAVAHG